MFAMAMPLSFGTLPVEIRLRVYECLFSRRHSMVVKIRPGSDFDASQLYLGYNFQTAIMLVNKSIRQESIEYFQSENGFVAVKTDLDVRYFSAVIPTIKAPNHGPPWTPAVDLHLSCSSSVECAFRPRRIYSFYIIDEHVEPFACMFSAYIGSPLVRRTEGSFTLLMALQERLSDTSFLRDGKLEPPPLHPNTIKILRSLHHFQGFTVTLFAGPIDPQLEQSLSQAWKRPCFGAGGVLSEGALNVEEAKRLIAAGDMQGARQMYKVAIFVMGPSENWARNEVAGGQLGQESELKRSILLSLSDAKIALLSTGRLLSKRDEEYVAACAVLTSSPRITGDDHDHERRLGDGNASRIAYHLGRILHKNCCWKDAIPWLRDARVQWPNDLDVEKMFNQACFNNKVRPFPHFLGLKHLASGPLHYTRHLGASVGVSTDVPGGRSLSTSITMTPCFSAQFSPSSPLLCNCGV